MVGVFEIVARIKVQHLGSPKHLFGPTVSRPMHTASSQITNQDRGIVRVGLMAEAATGDELKLRLKHLPNGVTSLSWCGSQFGFHYE